MSSQRRNAVYRLHHGGCNRKPHKPTPKNQKEWHSGKKKRHTIKTQAIIGRKSKKIIDVRQDKGSVHDFKMFKETIGRKVRPSIGIDADLGYLGIEKVHPNRRIPKKASEYHTLTKGDKAYNTRLARERVIIEHINVKINVFKIMAYPYCGTIAKGIY